MESAGRNKSSFFFYSDAHWSNDNTYTAKLAPTLLKYLYKNTPINKTNYGGDIVSAESTDTDIMAYLWDWRAQLRDLPNHHSVIGNHDDGNHTDRLLSKEYIYSYLLAPEENNDIVSGGDFYYYIDDKSEKTRYLYLDVFYDKASSEQLAFVSEALKSTPTDWHIVAICHAWFAVNYGTTANPIYPPVLNGFDTKAKILLDMFDNYNARSGEYSDCGGWVELCIGGHYHLDHYEHTSGGIPVIIVEADTFHDREHPMPTHGNIGESAISAVVVDYNNKIVKVIRVGRGNSFEVPIEVGEVTYTNVIKTSIGSNGAIFNNGQGWASNARIGSGKLDSYIGNGNSYITGHIEINQAINNTIRLKNVTFQKDTSNSQCGIAFYDENFSRVVYNAGGSDNWLVPSAISSTNGLSPVFDGTNIIEFTFKSSAHTSNTAIKYIAICADYIGDDSIITINEPID